MKFETILFILIITLFISGCSSQTLLNEEVINEEVEKEALSSLNSTEIDALNLALKDEYKAQKTYEAIMQEFADVRPFTNIYQAEITHSTRLEELFDMYNIEPPLKENVEVDISSITSIQEACQAGVQGEIENIALYDEILKSTQREDILRLYESLQSASQEKHLPAFERCS